MRDRDLKQPYVPLFVTGAMAMVSLEEEALAFGVDEPDESEQGSTCLPGHNAGRVVDHDSLGRRFSGHFIVPPGRHVYRTLVTEQMPLAYDTRVHYIAIHLHPFAESLELIDLTTKKSVYKSATRPLERGIGLSHVDSYSSREGVPLLKDHSYEVVAVYDNTTSKVHDAMAVMYLYAVDMSFKKP